MGQATSSKPMDILSLSYPGIMCPYDKKYFEISEPYAYCAFTLTCNGASVVLDKLDVMGAQCTVTVSGDILTNRYMWAIAILL